MQIDVRMTRGAEPVGHDGQACAGAPMGLAAGVNLRVPGGWRRVENLRRGDFVVTRDNGLQPVRLIWRRAVGHRAMMADPSLAPVRLKPRAVGPMMPRRDVLIGGGHRLLVPACRVAGADDGRCRLLAARDVAGRSDDAFVDFGQGDVVYFTLVFDCHQIVQAEGLPVETFQATATAIASLDDCSRTDLLRLFPELATSPSCYPPAEYEAAGPEAYRPEVV